MGYVVLHLLKAFTFNFIEITLCIKLNITKYRLNNIDYIKCYIKVK